MIPHNRPTLGDAEAAAASRVLASGWVAAGPEVEAFEAELADFLGLPAASVVMVSSGSAALFLAATVLGLAGARVGVPVYACSAVPDAMRLAGAEPVFIDSAADHPGLDPAASIGLDAAVAVLPFGLPVPVPREPRPILDLAQAIGATVGGVSPAATARAGILSFSATKLITSGGQGGAFFSTDADLVASARDFRSFDGREDCRPRFNLTATDLAAAIGRVQLARLPGFLARRRAIHDLYRDAGLPLLEAPIVGARPARHRAVLVTEHPDQVIAALAAVGVRAIVPIETREFCDPPERHPNAARLAATTVSLPIHPTLDDDDVVRIAETVKAAL